MTVHGTIRRAVFSNRKYFKPYFHEKKEDKCPRADILLQVSGAGSDGFGRGVRFHIMFIAAPAGRAQEAADIDADNKRLIVPRPGFLEYPVCRDSPVFSLLHVLEKSFCIPETGFGDVVGFGEHPF
jgi:hypothetical protein